MPDNKPRSITTRGGGMFQGLSNQIKLILRLLADSRVSPFLKLIPIGSLVYMVFPDLMPGPVDDAVLIWLSTYLFVELCPPNVVKEHLEAIRRTSPGQAQDAPEFNQEDIIEGEIIEGDDNEEKK